MDPIFFSVISLSCNDVMCLDVGCLLARVTPQPSSLCSLRLGGVIMSSVLTSVSGRLGQLSDFPLRE